MKWIDVIVVELNEMFGLLLLIGRVRKDRRDEYWSTEGIILVYSLHKELQFLRNNEKG